ncbi:MAG TPA: hypothetical protein VD794_07725 [Flavisolibacter sp.]|nr:hypothetical protein [Flavisolibacter sp.]
MTTEKLKVGGVYKTEWDDRPFRVIGLDDIEVFYDCLWPHDNKWTFSGNFKKKCYFYRTSAPLFAEKSTSLDFLALTDEEERMFRPDLPLRLGRTNELNWNEIASTDYPSFQALLPASVQSQQLPANQVVLIPYGNNGGFKKGTVVTAVNESFFEGSELLWKAKELQEAVNDKVSKGIGLYRIGFEKGMPSYYIGQYIDNAGLLKE